MVLLPRMKAVELDGEGSQEASSRPKKYGLVGVNVRAVWKHWKASAVPAL